MSGLRVLTVVDGMGGGGIETTLLRCIPGLRARGVNIELCLHATDGRLAEDYRALEVPVHRVPKTANLMRSARAVAEVLDRARVDILHSRLGYTGGGGLLAARWRRVPAILSLHSTRPGVDGWDTSGPRRFLRTIWLTANRAAIRIADPVVVGHSIANLDAFEAEWREQPQRFRHIPNGVATQDRQHLPDRKAARAQLGISPERPVLLHVGSMRAAKNHHALIKILQRIVAVRPDVLLVVVGDGPLRSTLEDAVLRAGLQGSVRFCGFDPDTGKYYRAADVFVFPSIHEGFGNVLVEAQLCRVPVVASDIPAHREAVSSAQHAALFHPDDLDQAAALVIQALDSRSSGFGSVLADSERFAREQFAIDGMAERLALLYEECSAQRRTQR